MQGDGREPHTRERVNRMEVHGLPDRHAGALAIGASPAASGDRPYGRSVPTAGATSPDGASPRPMPPRRRANAVMFHIGRSGSTVLADLLAQHADCFWSGEIYERAFQTLERQGTPLQSGAVPLDPVQFLAHVMSRADKPIYGFELKFYHLQLFGVALEDFLSLLDALEFRHFVVLERRNALRKIVSSLVAQQKNKYRQPSGEQASLTRVRLDVDALHVDRTTGPLVGFLQTYQERFRRLDQLLAGRSVLRLTYEDDIEPDPRIGYRRACEFLGIAPQPVDVRLGKSNPFPLAEILLNCTEVQQALSGTPFAWMLDE